MEYYKLKVSEEYWTLQKTTVNCKESDKYKDKEVALVSPRGRASLWLSDRGVLRVYTDKTITDYFSRKELNDLQTGAVSYQKDENVYYCSAKLDHLLSLIPEPIDEECKSLFEIIRKTKIQNSHKHKHSSNIPEESREVKETKNIDNFFGLFDEDGED